MPLDVLSQQRNEKDCASLKRVVAVLPRLDLPLITLHLRSEIAVLLLRIRIKRWARDELLD